MKNDEATKAPEVEHVDIVSLAIGRLIGMSKRQFKEGDHEEYDRLRAIIMADGKTT